MRFHSHRTLALIVATLLGTRSSDAAAQSRITTIDVPGSPNTFLYGLSNLTAVGQGLADDGVSGPGAAFALGSFLPYNVPGALGTSFNAINDRGQIVGTYYDSDYNTIAFLLTGRSRTEFAATPASLLTQPGGINSSGEIAGTYTEDWESMHAFVRRRDGIQTFDYPDADVFMTQAFNINDRGDIAGWFQNSAGSHGFVRDATGRFVSIDYPGAFLTRAFGINNRGVVVGYFQMARGAPAKGFTWSNGKFSVFDVPDSVGVAPQAINDTGAIAGYYRSADGAFHGFIATP